MHRLEERLARRCHFVTIDEGTGFLNPNVCAASVPGESGNRRRREVILYFPQR